jgi:hypothetical protein
VGITEIDAMRASDTDRDLVVELLGAHHEAGRLSLEEFDSRLSRALSARTHGELQAIMRDLPAMPAVGFANAEHATRQPVSRFAAAPFVRPVPFGELSPGEQALRVGWVIWTSAVSVNLVIWLLVSMTEGRLHYFWPAWVAAPLGAVLSSLSWCCGDRPARRTRGLAPR